jgi:hypothetical protein
MFKRLAPSMCIAHCICIASSCILLACAFLLLTALPFGSQHPSPHTAHTNTIARLSIQATPAPPHRPGHHTFRFTAWPVDALEAVAAKFLAGLDVPGPQRTAVSNACRGFHQDVAELSEQFRREAGRINYVTPTGYLELITAFIHLLGTKRAEVEVWMQERRSR